MARTPEARVGAPRTDAEAEARVGRLAFNTTRRMCFLPRGPVLFDADDAYAVAFEGGWSAHRRYKSNCHCRWDSWVIQGIRYSLQEAFRSFDYGAKRNRGGVRAPEFVPLEAQVRAFRTVSDDDSEPGVSDVIADPHDAFAAKDLELDCAAVIRVLRWLPPREAAVLRAHYLEGQTHKDIARRLERSESRVFQLHQQALVRARMMLETGRLG